MKKILFAEDNLKGDTQMENGIPIICRLEVEGMKHSILTALSKYNLQIDEYVNEAVEELCTQENIKRIIDDTVSEIIPRVIKDSLQSLFLYGPVREAIDKAIKEKFSEMIETLKIEG